MGSIHFTLLLNTKYIIHPFILGYRIIYLKIDNLIYNKNVNKSFASLVGLFVSVWFLKHSFKHSFVFFSGFMTEL